MVTPPLIEWFGGYALALVVGYAIGGWWFTRQSRLGDAAGDGLSRLPVFLRFDRHRVVVVGGGTVAAAKIPALVAAGGNVTVIAPRVSAAIDPARVTIIEREFEPADLDGAWFVTAAATPEVNRLVREAAEARGVFVNAVDDPANATAYLGGTLNRGGVTVAFSTAGQAPALAGLLREAFDELLPADIGAWVERAEALKAQQRADGVPITERRPQLLDALNRLYDSRELGSRSRA
jgi:uroporphyrin-III C-methyltransferase/precorrin-2 dehydrogenase/sirohydrochlorin ferrochelatase